MSAWREIGADAPWCEFRNRAYRCDQDATVLVVFRVPGQETHRCTYVCETHSDDLRWGNSPAVYRLPVGTATQLEMAI